VFDSRKTSGLDCYRKDYRKGKLVSPSLFHLSARNPDLMCGTPLFLQPYSVKGHFRDGEEDIRAVTIPV